MEKTKSAPQILKHFKIIVVFAVFFSLLALSLSLLVKLSQADDCVDIADPEFHTLRPYPMKPCGDAAKARYCSNDLIFTEDFKLDHHGDCQERLPGPGTMDFTCNPAFHVYPHTLYVQLDNSFLPIMGNTEDQMDDATKMSEYASWYLNGIIDKSETKDATNDQIVNFSGPVRKLLPSMIQDAQKISIINSATESATVFDDVVGADVTTKQNHDQLVIDKKRLSTWSNGSLSLLRTLSNAARDILSKIPGVGNLINTFTSDAWNKRIPPLPWDKNNNGTQFSELEYQKAYNEWKGQSCILVPLINRLFCFDNPGVTNEYADQWHYVPLANTSDKKGAEYILGDVPQYIPANGTQIGPVTTDKIKLPPLYFAHMQEVKDLGEFLNKTYTPKDVKSIPLPKSTGTNVCSAAIVRVNKGDNLFPGDTQELQVPNVEYDITQVQCHETWTREVQEVCEGPQNAKECHRDYVDKHSLECPAEVNIKIRTGTKTPWANELFSTMVADSGSTFRKIYPKVGQGAPVSCIADIPTVTGVTYDPDIGGKTQVPLGGTIEFKTKSFPEDSGGDSTQLTFPHLGSIYEYFLKGIQTALRPKGYGGEQPISGQNCTNISCGELPKGLPKASGSCIQGGTNKLVGEIPQSLKDILSAAAQTYHVPPNLILGVMYGEGDFNPGKYDWNDLNVKNWATCVKLPNCSDAKSSIVPLPGWDSLSKQILPDLKKADPTKTEADPCNLLDAVYGLAKNLNANAGGSPSMTGNSCYGVTMTSTIPNSCSWQDGQYESAIRVWEIGTVYDVASRKTCLTTPGTCAGGIPQGSDYTSFLCLGGDNCEKFSSSGNTSHNACVWDVAHSQHNVGI